MERERESEREKLTDVVRFDSFNPMMYTPEGKAITDRLWDETIAELEFAGVRDILQGMRGASA